MSALAIVRGARSEAEDVAAIMAGRTLAAVSSEDTASLLEFFRRNKYPLISLRGRADSEEWARAVEADIDECESQRAEYILVRNAWAREEIECIAFKSGGFYPPFPYTSDNLDILVRRKHWPTAVSILEQLGYVWLTNTDEANKILFRKFRGGTSVSAIHLHAWVGWDAEFHEEAIWDRARPSDDDPLVMVPSPEDVILINAAHAFYENKRFSLFDLERLRRYWGRGDIDWDYIEGIAARRGWLDGLFFALATCAHIERAYFGHTTAPEELQQRWASQLERWPVVRGYERRLLKRSDVALPFSVSFAFSKLLYERKLLGDSHDSPLRRASNVLHTLAWGIKQKTHVNPQRSMLITLSGIDGSGKTSHAAALSRALTTCDVTHRVVWSRPACSLPYRALSAIARRFSRPQAAGLRVNGAAPPAGGPLHKLARLAWVAANVADLTLVYTWSARVPLLFGTVVVCDRYASDAVIELRERLPPSDRLARRLAGLIETLAPTPRRAYLLDVDPETARSRSLDGHDVDAAGLRHTAYRESARRSAMHVCNANGAFEIENDAIVLEVLREYFRDFGTWLNGLLLSNPEQLNCLDDLIVPQQEVRL